MYLRVLIPGLFVVVSVGCDSFFTAESDLDLRLAPPRLVVQSTFNPDSVWSVVLARTLLPSEEGYNRVPIISEATVEIFQGGQLIETLVFEENPCFRADCPPGEWNVVPPRYVSPSGGRPQPGGSYELRVTAEGYPPVTARSSVPAKAPEANVEIIRTWEEPHKNGGMLRMSALQFNLADPPETHDFYFLGLSSRLTSGRSSQEYFTTSDPLLLKYSRGAFDVDTGERRMYAVYFPDALFSGREHIFEIEAEMRCQLEDWRDCANAGLADYRPFPPTVSSVSEEYYRFATSASLQQDVKRNPMAEPIEVYSNVEGGYGIFAGYIATVLAFDSE